MAEATKDIHDSETLDAGVSALISDAETVRPGGESKGPVAGAAGAQPPGVPDAAAATAANETDHDDGAGSEPEPAAVDVVPLTPGAAETVTEPVVSDVPTAGPPPTEAEPTPAGQAVSVVDVPTSEPEAETATVKVDAQEEPPDPDLADAVEKLLVDAGAVPTSESAVIEVVTPVAAGAPPETARIDSLDAELAGLADSLISDEFAEEVEAPIDPPAAATTLPTVSETAPTPSAPPPLAGQVAAPAAKAAPAAVAPVEAAAPVAATRKRLLPGAPGALALRAMTVLSGPLRNKPKHIRDAVGWMAAVNAFLALCVWGYVFVFRSSNPPLPPAKQVSHATDDGHGAKADSHSAEKPAKADAHGPAKAAKADSHAPAKPAKAPSKGAAADSHAPAKPKAKPAAGGH